MFICVVLTFNFVTTNAKGKGAYCFFQTEKSIYEDSQIKVSIVFYGSIVDLEVYNKTEKIVFIDKGSSFAYKNKEPICLFQNTSTTTTKTKGGGASVNLGSVSSALGVGGAIGTIASGVEVNRGSSNQVSTTTYEQRVLAVAPQATCALHRWGIRKDDIIYQIDKKQKEGRVFTFEENYTPCELRALITYSATEDFQKAEQISINSYVSTIVVDNDKGVYGLDLSKTQYCDLYRTFPFFAFKL